MSKINLFIIDKDMTTMDTLSKRFMLESSVSLCGTSQNGFEAYQKIQTLKPDCVIINAPLIDINILQLINAFKTVKQNITFIAILEYEDASLRMNLQNVGITNILVKPYDMEEIVAIVKSHISMLNDDRSEQTFVSSFDMSHMEQNQSNIPRQENTIFNPQPSPFNHANNNNFAMSNSVPQSFQSVPQQNNYEQSGFSQGGYAPFGAINQPVQNINESPLVNNGSGFRTIKQSIIAINCPKGGVGKTTISSNIATAYSMVKIGRQPLKVLLVDMDLEFGDVCSAFGMQPTPNITNWVSDIEARLALDPNANIQYTQAQIDQFLLTYPKTGLKILAAPSNHNDVLDISDKAVKIIIDNLKNNTNFDVIIFDTGNNTNNYTLYAMLVAHNVYEVVTMDIAAMNDLNMLLKTLRKTGFPMDRMKLVINRLPKSDKDFSIDEIANALGLSVAGVIPDYDKVRVRNNSGEPLLLDSRDNIFNLSIKNLANTMIGVNLFSKSRSVNKNVEKKSFFSRIFGK